ncbi:LexA family protein [Agromyces humi]|uniref:LexA family protein n=1 Tax=Agromyces humi TaxID=1766800 RepID=UPI00135CE3DA|nr:translesion error-prone DNA polymerase V autoproteolytic subunit [Agromyces humi]
MQVLTVRPATISDVVRSGPVFLAPIAVPAGFPSPAQDYYNGPIDLNEHLINDPTSTFIVRVAGDSMIGAGIYDGDEVIVDRSLTAGDGSVVIAVLDGELTLKRIHVRRDGRVALRSENPAFPDIPVPELGSLEVWGVVTRCLHHVT